MIKDENWGKLFVEYQKEYSRWFLTTRSIKGANWWKEKNPNHVFYHQHADRVLKNGKYVKEDVKWCDYPFGIKGTIWHDGCGPTSLAMILSSYCQDSSITPITITDFAKKYVRYIRDKDDPNIIIKNISPGIDIYKKYAESKGFTTVKFGSNDSKEIYKFTQAKYWRIMNRLLFNGYMAIRHRKGHFLVLERYYWCNGKEYINCFDPNQSGTDIPGYYFTNTNTKDNAKLLLVQLSPYRAYVNDTGAYTKAVKYEGAPTQEILFIGDGHMKALILKWLKEDIDNNYPQIIL